METHHFHPCHPVVPSHQLRTCDRANLVYLLAQGHLCCPCNQWGPVYQRNLGNPSDLEDQGHLCDLSDQHSLEYSIIITIIAILSLLENRCCLIAWKFDDETYAWTTLRTRKTRKTVNTWRSTLARWSSRSNSPHITVKPTISLAMDCAKL